MKKILLLLLFISCNNQSNENDESILNKQIGEVYLLNTLNDSRGYCIDMKGYKNNADINKSLQAHSCYSYQGEISVDQGFNVSNISNEEFYIPHFKVCMEAEKIEESSALDLKSCDKNNKQKFILQSDGKIQPKENLNLCLTVSDNFSEGGGGSPVHLIRTLSLKNCNDQLSSYQKWGIRIN
tara:strand:- start:362 stop:907 length:546 start_codon:yes stop_codon:yes gene_type:complete